MWCCCTDEFQKLVTAPSSRSQRRKQQRDWMRVILFKTYCVGSLSRSSTSQICRNVRSMNIYSKFVRNDASAKFLRAVIDLKKVFHEGFNIAVKALPESSIVVNSCQQYHRSARHIWTPANGHSTPVSCACMSAFIVLCARACVPACC